MTITLTKIKRGDKVNSVEFDAAGGRKPPVLACSYLWEIWKNDYNAYMSIKSQYSGIPEMGKSNEWKENN